MLLQKKYLLRISFALFILQSLFQFILADCPLSYYPEATFIGSIKANFNVNSLNTKQQEFSYNLLQPMTHTSPKVAIMISSFSYTSWGNFNFKIYYKPTPSFSTLVFSLYRVQQEKSKWQYILFSFFASQNSIFELGSQTVQSFTNVADLQNRKQITTHLPLNKKINKPFTKIFLNGIVLRGNSTKQQVDSIKTQIDGYRSFSWSSAVVKFLQKKVIQRESLYVQILNMTLTDESLTFYIDLGYKHNISSLSFSYVIFESDQSNYKNQYIHDRFNQSFSASNTFPALQHMDLFFLGLESFKIKMWQSSELSPNFQINQINQTFIIKDNFLQKDNYFLMSFLAFSKTSNSFCSHCKDANIIYDQFCVIQCPNNYVKKSNSKGLFCEFCDVKLFKVPNKDKNQCICANQYFGIASVNNNLQFTCSACNYQCLTCQSQYKCMTCDNKFFNTFRVLDDKSQCVCSTGYYDDSNNNIKCLKCHQSCVTCKGPSKFDCQSCPKGRTKGSDGNCICDNSFIDKNGNCTCQSPNFNYKGYCFTFLNKNKCLQNQIQVTINNQTKCQCKLGYQKFKNTCVMCPQNQTIDQQRGICMCKRGYYRNQKVRACLSCNQGKIYSENLKRCVCINGSFQNLLGECVTCKKRQTLINGKCECIYNYFKNDLGECERCKKDSTRKECTNANYL